MVSCRRRVGDDMRRDGRVRRMCDGAWPYAMNSTVARQSLGEVKRAKEPAVDMRNMRRSNAVDAR